MAEELEEATMSQTRQKLSTVCKPNVEKKEKKAKRDKRRCYATDRLIMLMKVAISCILLATALPIILHHKEDPIVLDWAFKVVEAVISFWLGILSHKFAFPRSRGPPSENCKEQ